MQALDKCAVVPQSLLHWRTNKYHFNTTAASRERVFICGFFRQTRFEISQFEKPRYWWIHRDGNVPFVRDSFLEDWTTRWPPGLHWPPWKAACFCGWKKQSLDGIFRDLLGRPEDGPILLSFREPQSLRLRFQPHSLSTRRRSEKGRDFHSWSIARVKLHTRIGNWRLATNLMFCVILNLFFPLLGVVHWWDNIQEHLQQTESLPIDRRHSEDWTHTEISQSKIL